jgi:hypothetical protein
MLLHWPFCSPHPALFYRTNKNGNDIQLKTSNNNDSVLSILEQKHIEPFDFHASLLLYSYSGRI